MDVPATFTDDPERDRAADAGEATPHGDDIEVLADDALRVIPVIAETLDVGRRELHGAVRVRKIVHENPITVDETLRDERVSVERVPIGTAVDGPVGIRYEGDVMVVPIVEERLVVEKRLVLTEEIRIRREVGVRREPQRVTLRQEQVFVERLDPKTREWSTVETPVASASPGAPASSGSGPSSPNASAGRVDEAAASISEPVDPEGSTSGASAAADRSASAR
jgi:uncharacterized protein (TIGR02271 family)